MRRECFGLPWLKTTLLVGTLAAFTPGIATAQEEGSPAEVTEEPATPAERPQPAAKPAAPAEEAAATAEPVEEITITGSRIGRSRVEDYSHITILTAKDIEVSGVQTIDELLTDIPTVTLQGISKNNNNGGLGYAMVDLRNLGTGRTLVLVNGRRFIKSEGSAVDLNNIPVSLVKRVDVLLDGASATYGSDAIGGVINVILKDTFEGVQVGLSGGITGHGDGEEFTIDTTMGTANDRGSVMANVTFMHRSEIAQADRDWSHYPVTAEYFNDDGTVGQLIGSGTSPMSREVGYTGYTFPSAGDPNDPSKVLVRPFTGADRYNYGDDQWLVGQMQRIAATLLGSYDISKSVKVYLEATFTKRNSRNRLAPQPLGLGTGMFPDPLTVPLTNPYIPPELAAALPAGADSVYLYNRAAQFGRRVYDNDTSTFNVVLGTRGDITDKIMWDVNVDYGQNFKVSTTHNSINLARVFDTLDPAVCNAKANMGCVVGNWFGDGNLDPAAINYAINKEREVGFWDMFIVGAEVKGDLFELPGGPFGMAFGVETRKETGYNRPDNLVQNGESAGNLSQATEGGYDNQEVFAEISAPLLKDLPAVAALAIDVAGRFSHYGKTFGDEFTYRAALSYSPIKSFKLRGIYSTAFRAPTIPDLYSGAADSYLALQDPCNDWENNPNATIRANCQSQGVPGNFDQNVSGGSQIRTNVGGNTKLDAETANVLNFGIVIQPTFLPEFLKGFQVSVDYYWVKVDNAITNPTPQWLLDRCYESAGLSHPNCAKLGQRNQFKNINYLDASLDNVAQIDTSGIDVAVAYGFPLSMVGGPESLRFDSQWQANILMWYNEQIKGDTEIVKMAGSIDSNNGTYAQFRWLLRFGLSGEAWSAQTRIRYVGDALAFGATPGVDPTTSVESVVYWDLVGTYTWQGLSVIFGVDNLLEREPPFFPEGGQNANAASYDFVGRYFYTKLGYKF